MLKRFFKSDAPLFKIMSGLMELAECNVLFLLCSLPVVTMGAAYTALSACCFDIAREEGRFSVSFFFRTFWRALRPSLPVWIIGAVLEALLFCNIFFSLSHFSGWVQLAACGIYIVLFLWTGGVLHFLFAFLARTEEWKKYYLKNSMLLSAAKFPMVIVIELLTLSPLTLFMMPGAFLLRMLPLIFLFWFSCPAYACSLILARILKPLFPELFKETDD